MEGRQLSIESNLECTRTHTHLELCIAQNHGCTTYCHTGRRVRTSLPVPCQRLSVRNEWQCNRDLRRK